MCVEINSLQGELKRCQKTKIRKQLSSKILRKWGIDTVPFDVTIESANPDLAVHGKHLMLLDAIYSHPVSGVRIHITNVIVDKNCNVLKVGERGNNNTLVL